MIRRLTAFVCLLAMLLSILPMGIFAEETVTQGNCGAEGDGSNLTWSFDESTHTLTISGPGAMKEYNRTFDRPWDELRSEVWRLVVSEGVTSISDRAFCLLWDVEAVTLPDSLQKIGADAFYNCSNLGMAGSVITLPKNLSEIGVNAFEGSYLGRDVLSVDSENTHFYMSKGCLIEKAEKKIIYACVDVEIPDDIEGLVIGSGAISDYTEPRLVVPSNVVKVEENAFPSDYITDIYFESSDVEIYDSEFTISSEVMIHGTIGSTAETYARRYNIPFGGFNDSLRKRGYCGYRSETEDNWTAVQWTVDLDTGSLIITGNGKMYDFTYYYAPWYQYASAIHNIYISEGVESISGMDIVECDIYIENPDALITGIPDVGETPIAFGPGSRIHGYKGSTAETHVKEANDEYKGQFGGDLYEFVLLTEHEHDYGSKWKSDIANHWYECKTCHNIIDEAEHSWDDGVTVTVDAGEQKKYTCEICGAERFESIGDPGHGHRFGGWRCDSSKHWRECSECQEKKDEGDHVWGDAVIIDETATRYTCEVCRVTKVVYGGITPPHDHEFGEEWYSNESKHWHECYYCFEKKDEADHNWDNGVTVTEATEDAGGRKKFTCETCGREKFEDTEKLPHTHNYGEEWKSSESKHWHECSKCHEKKDEADHNWDNGKVTKEPTKDADGEKLFTCGDCKATKTEKIEKLPTPPQTGLPVGIVITAILAAVLVVAFSIRKRKQYKTEG